MSPLQPAPRPRVNLDRADPSEWWSAEAAAARLGVSRATLYAYVSRGRLLSHAVPGTNARRYRASEVERLAAQHAGGHRPREAARATLDWGLPVLATGLTLIDRGQLFYRGQDALALAGHATLEDVARLLWQGEDAQGLHALQQRVRAAIGGRGRRGEPAHARLARAWGLDAAQADVLRAALVLAADHELNASSFTARCVASTGADLAACLAAAQAALSGPRHGGMTARVEAQWDLWDAAAPRALAPAVRRWVEASRSAPARRGRAAPGGLLCGFGHPLYPQGDPRARALLARLPRQARRERVVATVHEAAGLAPALDFALVALRRAFGLPRGAAFEIFAIARTVGWVAHVREQRASGTLIRPRAAYVGPLPQAPARGRVVRHG